MFVQATENEQLKKEIQQAADRNKISLKIIEKVDNNIRKEIQRSDPFKSESCGRKDCTICGAKNVRGSTGAKQESVQMNASGNISKTGNEN